MIRINQDKGYDLKLTLVMFEDKVCGKKIANENTRIKSLQIIYLKS